MQNLSVSQNPQGRLWHFAGCGVSGNQGEGVEVFSEVTRTRARKLVIASYRAPRSGLDTHDTRDTLAASASQFARLLIRPLTWSNAMFECAIFSSRKARRVSQSVAGPGGGEPFPVEPPSGEWRTTPCSSWRGRCAIHGHGTDALLGDGMRKSAEIGALVRGHPMRSRTIA